MIGRQRLNRIFLAMIGGNISEDSLVQRTGDGELCHWILSQFHIRETLMRESLDDGRRHFWQSCFRIISVPKIAFSKITIFISHICNEIFKQCLGKILGCKSGNTRIQFLIIEVGCANSQRSIYRFAVWIVSRITMNGK